MAYNEALATRLQHLLGNQPGVTSREMFGGIAFMVEGKMAVGVIKDDLLLRLDPEGAEAALRGPHTRPMDFAKRPMSGYIYVSADGYRTAPALRRWVAPSVAYARTLARAPAKKRARRA